MKYLIIIPLCLVLISCDKGSKAYEKLITPYEKILDEKVTSKNVNEFSTFGLSLKSLIRTYPDSKSQPKFKEKLNLTIQKLLEFKKEITRANNKIKYNVSKASSSLKIDISKLRTKALASSKRTTYKSRFNKRKRDCIAQATGSEFSKNVLQDFEIFQIKEIGTDEFLGTIMYQMLKSDVRNAKSKIERMKTNEESSEYKSLHRGSLTISCKTAEAIKDKQLTLLKGLEEQNTLSQIERILGSRIDSLRI